MDEPLRAIPTPPTLVISLGRRAAETCLDTSGIFLRSVEHRRITTAFLSMQPLQDEHERLGLVPLNESQATENHAGQSPERQLETVIAAIKADLETALHGLRLHGQLIEVGLGEERDLPLGVIVLVDLADPSARCFPVLQEALRRLLELEPNHYAYLLGLTAVFTEGQTAFPALGLVYANLVTLAGQLGTANWPFHVFLFDRFKEGVLEVKDDAELCLLTGNFLLALLSGRFAQQLDQVLPRSEVLEKEAYYNSASATALTFDPEALVDDCAVSLGKRVLRNEFCARDQTPPKALEQIIQTILGQVGDLSLWTERACAETCFQRRLKVDLGFDLHFSDLQFEGLPAQEWGDAIVGYADYFQREKMPLCHKSLDINAGALSTEVLAVLNEQGGLLPQLPALYPGGAHGAMQVINRLLRLVQEQLQDCLPLENEDALHSSLEFAYEQPLDEMDRLIASFPAPPRWMRKLPRRLYAFALQVFNFLFLRAGHHMLIAQREICISALEQKFTLDFEQAARRHFTDLCHTLIENLSGQHQQLEALLAAFGTMQEHLAEQEANGNTPDSPFRLFLRSESLSLWACEYFSQPDAEVRNALLNSGYLTDWKQASQERLEMELLAYCRNIFAPLKGMQVEDLLQNSNLADTRADAAMLAQSAVPLLRPDFDLAGDGGSFPAQYFLCANPRESGLFPELLEAFGEWQAVPTGDLLNSLCCRVRLMLAGSTLQALFQRGQEAYLALSEEQRQELPCMQPLQSTGEDKK